MVSARVKGGLGAALVVAALGYAAIAQNLPAPPPTPPMPAAEAQRTRAWDFTLTAIDGAPLPLARYRGQVVLLVNTASFCGLAPQFEGLKQIYADYAAKGFTVIAVPSGNFKDQEYGSNKAIADHCRVTMGVKFPLAEKSEVVGPKAIPIYRWAAARFPEGERPHWNFHKYLIGRDGRLVAAFGSRTVPTDPKITGAIEAALRAPRRG